MFYTLLPQRGLIRLTGADTLPFLQGLVSNDVMPLSDGKTVYAALLTPQGKFLHDFFLIPFQDGVLIDSELSRRDELIKRLTMYRLRSNVVIEPLEFEVGAFWGGGEQPAPSSDPLLFADPRFAALGFRAVGASVEAYANQNGMDQATPADYDAMRLALGVPEGGRDLVAEKSFLLPFGFEELHGVDFKKGCYIGQEVTARSKHRGEIKKALYIVRAASELPEPGTAIQLQDKQVGELRSHAGTIGLALIEKESAGAALQVAGQPLSVSSPPWSV